MAEQQISKKTSSRQFAYDSDEMSPELTKAYNTLGKEVMKFYGYSKDTTEDE